MTIQLTDQQTEGLTKVKMWYENAGGGFGADVFRWFGYAGTGKTFTAARIPEALGLSNVVFGTYTGKAASVLRRSLSKYGVHFPVTTIHSAIYFPTQSAQAKAELEAAEQELYDLTHDEMVDNAERIAELEDQIPQLQAAAKRLRWEFNPDSDWANADLIILDEVSMVNAKLAADIESYGVPILVLGDPAQLPPVEGGGYYTNAQADHLLTEIQRAALDSPVTALATRIRESKNVTLGLNRDDMRPKSLRDAMQADVVLVWSNKRRWSMINAIRAKRFNFEVSDSRRTQPVVGDVVMCLTNNKDMAVFNGELFEVLDVRESPDANLGYELKVMTETGLERDIPVWGEGFVSQDEQTRAKNTGMGMRGNRMLATFAQAITVHKAQGSEWDHVYVVNETPGMIAMTARRAGQGEALAQGRQWLYTAVTRAKGRVSISTP